MNRAAFEQASLRPAGRTVATSGQGLGGKFNTIIRSLFGSFGLKALTVLVTFTFHRPDDSIAEPLRIWAFLNGVQCRGPVCDRCDFRTANPLPALVGRIRPPRDARHLRGTLKYGAAAIAVGTIVVGSAFMAVFVLIFAGPLCRGGHCISGVYRSYDCFVTPGACGGRNHDRRNSNCGPCPRSGQSSISAFRC